MDDPVVGFEVEGAELETGARHVAVIWSGDETESPEVVFGGCTTFEAFGLLTAATKLVGEMLARSIELPPELTVDLDDDEASDA